MRGAFEHRSKNRTTKSYPYLARIRNNRNLQPIVRELGRCRLLSCSLHCAICTNDYCAIQICRIYATSLTFSPESRLLRFWCWTHRARIQTCLCLNSYEHFFHSAQEKSIQLRRSCEFW